MDTTILDSRAYADRASDNGRSGKAATYSIVEYWHNETHPGVFRFCSQQPCHAIHLAQRPA